jgi:hypothetical protein
MLVHACLAQIKFVWMCILLIDACLVQIKVGLFGSKPLQFFQFGETPLQFLLLEKRHCNSSAHASSPFSTSPTDSGLLLGVEFAYPNQNAPRPSGTASPAGARRVPSAAQPVCMRAAPRGPRRSGRAAPPRRGQDRGGFGREDEEGASSGSTGPRESSASRSSHRLDAVGSDASDMKNSLPVSSSRSGRRRRGWRRTRRRLGMASACSRSCSRGKWRRRRWRRRRCRSTRDGDTMDAPSMVRLRLKLKE